MCILTFKVFSFYLFHLLINPTYVYWFHIPLHVLMHEIKAFNVEENHFNIDKSMPIKIVLKLLVVTLIVANDVHFLNV